MCERRTFLYGDGNRYSSRSVYVVPWVDDGKSRICRWYCIGTSGNVSGVQKGCIAVLCQYVAVVLKLSDIDLLEEGATEYQNALFSLSGNFLSDSNFVRGMCMRKGKIEGYFTLEADAYLSKFDRLTVYEGIKDLCFSAKRLAELYENG